MDKDISFLTVDGKTITGDAPVVIGLFKRFHEDIKNLKDGERKEEKILMGGEGKGSVILVSLHSGSSLSADLIEDDSEEYKELASSIR